MAGSALSWSLDLNTSGFSRSIQGAQKQLSGLASTNLRQLIAPLAGIAASVGSVAAIGAGIKSALNLGSEMTDLANRTGIAVENLYGLKIAFKDAGVDAQALGPAVNKMQKSLASAVGGGKEANVLKSLGLDPQTLASMDSGKAFTEIGNAIAALPNSTERSAAAMEIFGRSGAELLQVFMDPNFKDAGNISNTAKLLAQNAGIFDKASDSLGHVPDKLKGLFIGVSAGMTGVLDQLADSINKVDLSNVGVHLGYAVSNFHNDFQKSIGDLAALSAQLLSVAFSPVLIKPLGAELISVAKAFGEELAKQIPGGVTALEKYRNLAANITSSLYNSAAYSSRQGEYEQLAKIETNPQKKALYQQESDRLKKLIDAPAFSTQATGIDYAAESKEADKKLKQEASDGFAKLMESIKGIVSSSPIFTASPQTLAENAKATADNSNRVLNQGAYNAQDIGMGAKASIVADSFAKIGGGGTSSFMGVIDVNRQQLTAQQQTNRLLEQYLKGAGGFSAAQLAR